MWYKKSRLIYTALFVVGIGGGWLVVTTDPPARIIALLFVGIAVGGGLLSGLNHYRMQQTGEYDERSEEIELHANRASYSTVIVGLSLVVGANLVGDLSGYLDMLLVGLLLGGVAVDELYIEWYRRKL